VIRSYKFGVVMLLPGQTLEYQGLTNTKGTSSSPPQPSRCTHAGAIIRRESIKKGVGKKWLSRDMKRQEPIACQVKENKGFGIGSEKEGERLEMHEELFFLGGKKRRGKCACSGACSLFVGRAHIRKEGRRECSCSLVVNWFSMLKIIPIDDLYALAL